MVKNKNVVTTTSSKTLNNIKFFSYRKCIIFGFVFLFIILIVCTNIYINNKYNEAIVDLDNQEYEKAYEILSLLGGSKAMNKIQESKHSRAKEYIKNGDNMSAVILLDQVKEYEDSQKLIVQILNDNDYLKTFVSNVNDEVLLGKYEQDNNIENGKEPIEWIIIDKSSSYVTLIAKYVLDVKKFGYKDNYDQLECWLKTDFVKENFNDEELSILSDVRLLSMNEVDLFVNNGLEIYHLKSSLTEYALSKDIYKIDASENVYTWWLSDKNKYNDAKQYYTFTNTSYYKGVGLDVMSCSKTIMNGVRPVIVVSNNGDFEIKDYNLEFDKLEETEVTTSENIKDNYKSSSSNKNSYSGSKCNGGVSCRAGWHACNPHSKTGYCRSCCYG